MENMSINILTKEHRETIYNAKLDFFKKEYIVAVKKFNSGDYDSHNSFISKQIDSIDMESSTTLKDISKVINDYKKISPK